MQANIVQIGANGSASTEVETKPVYLFPTVVAESSFSQVTKAEKDFISSLARKPNTFNSSSENRNLLEARELSRLKEIANNAIAQYVNTFIKPKNPIDCYITQSWANWTKESEAHHRHNHPNSFLSGVMYIQSSSDDSITFFRERNLMFEIEPSEYVDANSTSWWLPTVENTLYIFPSGLEHEVAVKSDDKERISIAFNTFINGVVGNADNLTELRI